MSPLGLPLQAYNGPLVLMVNGQKAPFLGDADVEVQLSGQRASGKMYVLDMDGIPMLLGNDILRQFGSLEIQYGGDRPKLLLHELPVGLLGEELACGPRTLVTKSSRFLPPNSLSPVEVESPVALEHSSADWLPVPSPRLAGSHGLSTGNVILNGYSRIERVLMLNLSGQPKFIHQGTVIGNLEPVEPATKPVDQLLTEGDTTAGEDPDPTPKGSDLVVETSGSSDLGRSQLEESFRAQISATLSEPDREKLVRLLCDFRDGFASKDDALGLCIAAEHQIRTGTAGPAHQQPYPNAWREREIIQQHVDKMSARGIIEPSTSPWSSPIVLAKKKDGDWRFCVNYRNLNAITTKDVYPLPRIESTLARLHGARIFTIMDLECGYW